MKTKNLRLPIATLLVFLVLALAIVSFLSRLEKISNYQFLDTNESGYVDLDLVINEINYKDNLLSVRASYNFSPELSDILSNVVDESGSAGYEVRMMVTMPQEIHLTGITAIPGWSFTLDKPNTQQNIQIPIFNKANMAPFDNYTYAVQVAIYGLSDIDNNNMEKLELKSSSPVATRIRWSNRLDSYSVEATRGSQKVVDVRVAEIQKNQVDFNIKRNPIDIALGVVIPVTLLLLYLLFRTGLLSLAIPLIGFVTFRQVLVPTGVQGFTLYDIAIISVLAFAVVFHIWVDGKSSSQVPNKAKGTINMLEKIRSTIGLAGIGFIVLCLVVGFLLGLRGLNYAAAVATIIGVLIGALALVLYLWVQRIIGPKTEIILGERVERPDIKCVFLHLAVVNHPLSGWVEKVLSSILRAQRQHATCLVQIDFVSRDEQEHYVSSMLADWSRNPEPFSVFYDTQTQSLKPFLDVTKKDSRSIIDVRPTGKGERLGIVLKYEGQKECYAFNVESYFGGTKGKPWCLDRYRIEAEGTVIVASLISGGVRSGPYKFLLVNKGTSFDEEHFRLEKLPTTK